MHTGKIIVLLVSVFLFFTLASADNFDYEFLRMAQTSSAEGILWMKLTKQEKAVYLMGYEDGYLNALAYPVANRDVRDSAVSKLPSFYDMKNINRDDLIPKLDIFYAQYAECRVIPVPLAIRLIISKELDIKNELDEKQVIFFEDMLKEMREK